ncbi:riboflavin synthase [Atractiella rhizophila]|nr:riboflavin synthase [Atractiella rhizophila]
MFTGLIEHIGTVSAIVELDTSSSGGGGWTVTIGDSASILGDCHIGDSICVNGTCLTVTEFSAQEGWFKLGLAPETLRRTNLGELKVGSPVNLERAMGIGARYGGHYVQGHVDTTAEILSITPDGNALSFLFHLPAGDINDSLLTSLLPKGFITLDGTSLTLTSVDDEKRTFGVMLIAHTQEKIIMTRKKVGDKVNVEADLIAKGVEKVVRKLLGENEAVKKLISQGVQTAIQASS